MPINNHVKNVTEPYGIPLWHKIFAIARNFYNVLRSLAFSPKLFVVFCLECQQPGGSTCDLAADKQQRGTCHLTIHSHRLQSLKLSRLLKRVNTGNVLIEPNLQIQLKLFNNPVHGHPIWWRRVRKVEGSEQSTAI